MEETWDEILVIDGPTNAEKANWLKEHLFEHGYQVSSSYAIFNPFDITHINASADLMDVKAAMGARGWSWWVHYEAQEKCFYAGHDQVSTAFGPTEAEAVCLAAAQAVFAEEAAMVAEEQA